VKSPAEHLDSLRQEQAERLSIQIVHVDVRTCDSA
jgi:hypothetical protein